MRRFGRTRLRVISRRIRASGTPPAVDGDPNAIVGITDDGGGKAVFETGAAHGLVIGHFITIEATEIYDGAGHEINNTPTATTFTTVDDYYAGSATGTWTLETPP